MDLLNVENLTVKLGDKKVINNFSFSIQENDILAVLVPNSGGKTTLIRTLSGIIVSDDGKVFVNSVPLNRKWFKKYILNIGTVFDNINSQFLCDVVKDELKYPMIHLCYNPNKIRKQVEIISEIVGIDAILNKRVIELSNLEKVKVLIATSIVHSPKLLLLDDVFKFLNKNDSKEILRTLKNINKLLNIAILFTTSDINDVIDIDNIIVLNNGRKMLEGDFESIIKEDNELSKIGLVIPIMIDLSRKLQFYNLIDEIYYDVDKVVDNLWK